MSQAYSLKADYKPTLFSWDLDTEFKNIESWVLDNKNYSRRDLKNELSILRKLASDYFQIIQTKRLESEQEFPAATEIAMRGVKTFEHNIYKLKMGTNALVQALKMQPVSPKF